jgi:DNA polymerase III delta prime subunit
MFPDIFRIKMFAQQKVTLPKGRHKIIILDEADSMTEVNLLANL